MKLLCLAAWEPELTRFRELAPSWIAMEPVGIGVVEAAAATAELVALRRPDLVVFMGTCGSMRPDLARFDVVFAERVRLVDLGGGVALHAVDQELPVEGDLRAALAAAGAAPARVANTIGVTTTDALAARVAEHGDVEHLEAFGVARACARAGVTCAILLAVANEVGARGRDQWKESHVEASARVGEATLRFVSALEVSRRSTTARSPA